MSDEVGGRDQVVAGLVRIQELQARRPPRLLRMSWSQAARMEESSKRLGRSITKQV